MHRKVRGVTTISVTDPASDVATFAYEYVAATKSSHASTINTTSARTTLERTGAIEAGIWLAGVMAIMAGSVFVLRRRKGEIASS